uniref:Uncharacterized protein n=1 Tax=Romanomermis culicivorax TaxID=13658 RepID=A0A915LAK8_ROMCU
MADYSNPNTKNISFQKYKASDLKANYSKDTKNIFSAFNTTLKTSPNEPAPTFFKIFTSDSSYLYLGARIGLSNKCSRFSPRPTLVTKWNLTRPSKVANDWLDVAAVDLFQLHWSLPPISHGAGERLFDFANADQTFDVVI